MLWNSGERDGRNIGSAYNCLSGTCEFDSFSGIFTVYIPEVGRKRKAVSRRLLHFVLRPSPGAM